MKNIPKNLNESISTLKQMVDKTDQDKIASGELSTIVGHHGIGRWMRNNWGLWGGSELKDWFIKKGITHADDMSGIILKKFEKDLQNKQFDLDKEIQHYRTYWKEQNINPDTMESND